MLVWCGSPSGLYLCWLGDLSPEACSWARPGRLGKVDPSGCGGRAGQVRRPLVSWRVNLRHSMGEWSRVRYTSLIPTPYLSDAQVGEVVFPAALGEGQEMGHSQCPHSRRFSSWPESSCGNCPACLEAAWSPPGQDTRCEPEGPWQHHLGF